MKKARLTACLDLIQKLLTCPRGEEWIYLKQNENLVDAEFLQVMEQIAMQLERRGSRDAATFLHSWAAKLHHILLKEIQPSEPDETRSAAYIDLIEQLLNCPEGMEEQLLIAHETLIGPGLVHKMRQVASQLRQRQEAESAEFLEEIADGLNQAWMQEYARQSESPKSKANQSPDEKIDPSETDQKSNDSMARPLTMASAPDQMVIPTATILSDDSTMPMDSDADEDVLADPWLMSDKTSKDKEILLDESAQTAAAQSDDVNPVEVASRAVPAEQNGYSSNFSQAASGPEGNSLNSAEAVGQQAIADGLNAIARALEQLNQTLQTGAQLSPLEHLEQLDRACEAGWQLTTDELEQLLGVRPKCHGDETVFRRGEWSFMKVGKVGSQTAWQVHRQP